MASCNYKRNARYSFFFCQESTPTFYQNFPKLVQVQLFHEIVVVVLVVVVRHLFRHFPNPMSRTQFFKLATVMNDGQKQKNECALSDEGVKENRTDHLIRQLDALLRYWFSGLSSPINDIENDCS